VGVGNQVNLGQFIDGPLTQERRRRLHRRHAVIDDPGPGFNAGPAQIRLQVGSLENRRRFGQRRDQHIGLFGIQQKQKANKVSSVSIIGSASIGCTWCLSQVVKEGCDAGYKEFLMKNPA
jgi:hypothetical protein